jgi:preprotein translocase subunit SecD
MSLRARLISLVAVVLGTILAAYPSFFSEEERRASGWIPDAGLTLGLDLQGGIHWVLSIDTEKAVEQEIERVRKLLAEDAEKQGFALGTAAVNERGELELRGADTSKVQARIEEDFPTVSAESRDGVLRLRLTDTWRREVVQRGVRQALEVLRRRVDGLGVREPVIAPQGDDRILVQMPGQVDPVEARKMISRTTFLQFKHVLDSAETEELLRARHATIPDDQEVVVALGSDGSVREAYLVPKVELLTGAMLEDARLIFGRRNEPLVNFTWNAEGTRIFREFTGEHIGERLAAVLDGEVLTAPVIRSRIGREGQIEGRFTQEEAANLAVALRSGALPIPLVIEEERAVGPALGADSIRQGVIASAVGSVLVIAFMLAYYSVSGAIANVAVLLNLAMIIALMGAFEATLTLPGIAGLVLTVGMAVDANVLIFERIREELRLGKPLRTAVQQGFRRSALTIVDANLTTMIAAFILYYLGSGPVQGFGVTLGIGIVTSVFCALFVSRVLIDVWVERTGSLKV